MNELHLPPLRVGGALNLGDLLLTTQQPEGDRRASPEEVRVQTLERRVVILEQRYLFLERRVEALEAATLSARWRRLVLTVRVWTRRLWRWGR